MAASLLLLSLLDVPRILGLSSALCPHTAFYHGCWIRRFPGLVLSFAEPRGARLLQRRPEPSAQICSRRCCHQDSCNVAVYYSEASGESGDCQLGHCPEPESCLLQLRERSVLYTVTPGVDPDLLVFEQLGHIDLNPRSSFKWERLNISRVPPTLGPSAEPHSLLTHPHDEPLQPTQPPPPQPPSPADSPLRSLAPTHSPPITAQDTTSAGPRGAEDPAQEAPPSSPPMDQPELQSPEHLDSSKQHVNETKGHGGRNQTYEGDTEDPADTWTHLWPLPTMIGSSVTLLCCCSGVLAFGCCRRRRRGRYRPWRALGGGTRTLITCTLLKEDSPSGPRMPPNQ